MTDEPDATDRVRAKAALRNRAKKTSDEWAASLLRVAKHL